MEPGTCKYNDVGCVTEVCGALERWEETFLSEWCQVTQSPVVHRMGYSSDLKIQDKFVV
jgi:hypothetical protein